jgi:predicted Zn-dependent protease
MRIYRFLFILLAVFVNLSKAHALNVIRDLETEEVITKLVEPIAQLSGISKTSINLYIYSDPAPNAMVIAGQNIFVSTALLSFNTNPDAFIGVMAHEMGHIKGGHLVSASNEAKYIQKKFAIGLLSAVIAGFASKSPEIALGGLNASQSMANDHFFSFSKSQELAADRHAINTMKKLDVNPTGLIEFLVKIKHDISLNIHDGMVYYNTHPSADLRIDSIKAALPVKEYYSYPALNLRQKFERASKKIFAFTEDPSIVLKRFEKDSSIDAKYAKSIAHYRSSNISLALAQLDEIIAVEPTNPHFLELKGQILYEYGDFAEAVRTFEAAMKSSRHSDILRYQLAVAMLSHNVTLSKKAANFLYQNVSENPSDVASWKALAQAYVNTKELEKADIATAYYSFWTGSIDIANKYIAKLNNKKLSADDAAKLNQLKTLIENYELSV